MPLLHEKILCRRKRRRKIVDRGEEYFLRRQEVLLASCLQTKKSSDIWKKSPTPEETGMKAKGRAASSREGWDI